MYYVKTSVTKMVNKKIFLLGGMDLEMCVIRDMLKEHNIAYHDRNLKWNNAAISRYSDILDKYKNQDNIIIYGIELTEDMSVPDNYVCIDHHNDFSHKPSSLEQTATILGIEMSYFYKLVSANDKDYIPGMQKIGATEQDIIRIRTMDRKCQGVTEEDEKAAEKSINENTIQKNNITIVHSYTSCFSAICDRLYPCNNLLIYTDKEASYYGSKVSKLIEKYARAVKENKMYYGGDNGYFGVSRGAYNETELNEIITQIINICK